MGKRRRDDEDEEILRKLDEIQLQLSKRRRKSPQPRRRVRRISSEDETIYSDHADNTTGDSATPTARHATNDSRRNTHATQSSDEPSTSSAGSVPAVSAPNISTAPPAGADGAGAAAPTFAEQLEDELDNEILQLLGDAPKCDVQMGDNVHKEIASRWNEILIKGLSSDNKEKLLKEYLIPGNCEYLIPPILNEEVKAALPETLIRRDAFLVERQRQIGIALAALANATHMLIKKEDHPKILKAMSDAGRLLCDVHFDETKSRKNFVISATNSTMKDTLCKTQRDKYLFGQNVSEVLKSAKSVQKSGADLKKTQLNKNPKFHKSNFYKNKYLNTRALQRKSSSKPDAGKPRQPAAAAPTTWRYTKPGSQRARSPPPPPRKNARRY